MGFARWGKVDLEAQFRTLGTDRRRHRELGIPVAVQDRADGLALGYRRVLRFAQHQSENLLVRLVVIVRHDGDGENRVSRTWREGDHAGGRMVVDAFFGCAFDGLVEDRHGPFGLVARHGDLEVNAPGGLLGPRRRQGQRGLLVVVDDHPLGRDGDTVLVGQLDHHGLRRLVHLVVPRRHTHHEELGFGQEREGTWLDRFEVESLPGRAARNGIVDFDRSRSGPLQADLESQVFAFGGRCRWHPRFAERVVVQDLHFRGARRPEGRPIGRRVEPHGVRLGLLVDVVVHVGRWNGDDRPSPGNGEVSSLDPLEVVAGGGSAILETELHLETPRTRVAEPDLRGLDCPRVLGLRRPGMHGDRGFWIIVQDPADGPGLLGDAVVDPEAHLDALVRFVQIVVDEPHLERSHLLPRRNRDVANGFDVVVPYLRL